MRFRSLISALVLLGVILGATLAQVPTSQPPTIILGSILTLDPAMPRADSIVLRNGLIESVGSTASVALASAEPGARILKVPPGGVAMPGIIESHAHFLAVGRSRRMLDLRHAQSYEAVIEDVARAINNSAEHGTVLGRGWNQELWPTKTLPDREALDRVSAGRAVILSRVDGHAVLANSVALDRAGITSGTRAPSGGEILKRSDGTPSGVLVDNAISLLDAVIPKDDAAVDRDHDALAAQEAAFASGITTFVDAGASIPDLLALGQLYASGRLKLRLYSMASVNNDADLEAVLARPPILSAYDDRVSVRAVKLYADGALGSRGAWLLEPYSDRPEHSGLATVDPIFIQRVARQALERGYQVCVHAIGDRAVRETLDAFERAFADAPAALRGTHRFRIEHAQHIHTKDLPRFRKLGVLPSMQSCHATSDGPWVTTRLGAARAESGAYMWRSLLDLGCIIPNGTDSPVENLSPFENLHAAVTRVTDLTTSQAFYPAQRMNRYEALQSLTTWGAFGAFAESRRGKLRPGFQADVILLALDPEKVVASALRGITPEVTIVAGEIVYSRTP